MRGKDPAGSDTPEIISSNEVASDRLIGGLMNFDRLAAQVSERHMMVDALLNLARFRDVEAFNGIDP